MAEEARVVLKVPRVNSCCCGCSLETGTKIIAFIHIIVITGLFLMAISLYIYDEHMTGKRRASQNETWTGPQFNAGMYTEDFMLTTIIGNVVFAACLLRGTYQKEPFYFEPWLILKAIAIFLSFFNIGLFTVLRVIGHRMANVFAQLFHAALESYMYIVVYSLYKQYKSTLPHN